MAMASQFSDMMSSWNFFVFLFKFSYWSKFHVNIITGSGVMTIYFCKGLTRNLQIGNTPIRVFPNIWRLEQVSNTKFGKIIFNKVLLNPEKFQGYNFYRFWVVKRKPTRRGGKITPPPPHTHTHTQTHTHTHTQIRVNTKRLEAEKNNDKDEKVSHKLINNAIHGKTMENVRKRIDVKLVKKKKDYLKCTSKPSYMSQKIFHNNLVAIRNSKRAA